MNKIVIGILYCICGEILVWFQMNAQFVWPSILKYYWLIIILGGSITSWFFITGVRYMVSGFDGQIWPSRLIPNATGMIIFSILTWLCLKQGIDTKTGVCLLLSILILVIQLYWK